MAFEHKTRGAGDVILSADWNSMGDEIQRVGRLLEQDEKKETVNLPIPLKIFGKGTPKSPLSVAGGAAIGAGFADRTAAPENGLIVEGSVGVGTPAPAGKLNVVHKEEDAGGGSVILGPTATSNLRLGYHKDYSWMQSHGGRPLKINPLGNDVSIGTGVVVQGDGDVGVGTGAPQAKLHVEGDALLNGGLTVRDDVQFGNRTRQMLNLWKQEYGIGIQGATHYFRTGGHFAWYRGGKHDDAVLNAGGGTPQMVIRDSGNLGIGTGEPQDRLEVKGAVRMLTDSNAIRFTSAWTGFPDGPTNQAEISNDTGTYKTLMIVGNKSAGVGRRVSVWDRLEVNGSLEVTGKMRCRNAREATSAANKVDKGAGDWANVPDMALSVDMEENPLLVLFKTGGVQIAGVPQGRARFRMLVDGSQVAFSLHEFHNAGWELRDVSLSWIGRLSKGRHQIAIQWHVEAGTLSCCWYGDTRHLMAIEL